MKPIIGIIAHPFLSDEHNKIYGVYNDVINAINLSGGLSIGILSSNWQDIISICDGLIFQGGDNFIDYEKECLKYAYNNDIPTLGICLGMQLMGVVFDAKEYEVFDHKEKNKIYVHKVLIDVNSKLYSILEEREFLVNSRHKTAIKDPKIDVVAISSDCVIEAIEDKTKKFFIGVQWHPETIIKCDRMSQKLFKYFIKVCRK